MQSTSDILFSICIPTYNGEDYLGQTLDSILAQQTSLKFDIIISDDCSSDDTLKIAYEYQEKHPQVKVFKNDKNLGMDLNFTNSVLKSTAKYVWLCGQDDILKPGTFLKIEHALSKYPEINLIYYNYRFFNDDLTIEIDSPRVNLESDMFFNSPTDYFQKVDHPPSFLPATFMKREYWNEVDSTKYHNTYYVQMGVWMESMIKGNILVISSPDYVICRIPDKTWKKQSGKMLMGTHIGTLVTYAKANLTHPNLMPSEIMANHKSYFRKIFLHLLLKVRGLGYNLTDSDKTSIRFIFNDNLLLKYFYFSPIVILPNTLIRLSANTWRIIKASLLR